MNLRSVLVRVPIYATPFHHDPHAPEEAQRPGVVTVGISAQTTGAHPVPAGYGSANYHAVTEL
jgi:hypothetical protein